jgi:hypothetical protein
MGIESGQFFLSHGGFVPGFTKYGEKFTRPAEGKEPSDIELPEWRSRMIVGIYQASGTIF